MTTIQSIFDAFNDPQFIIEYDQNLIIAHDQNNDDYISLLINDDEIEINLMNADDEIIESMPISLNDQNSINEIKSHFNASQCDEIDRFFIAIANFYEMID